ncbi:MAG: M23 family metallopeptidase [Candidatus Methylomirabilia bacterium]
MPPPLRAGLLLLAFLLGLPASAFPHEQLEVRWEPRAPRQGDVAVVFVKAVGGASSVEGSLGEQSLSFFPDGEHYAALVGIDLLLKPAKLPWRISITDTEGTSLAVTGSLRVRRRQFPVQRLTLPPSQVDLDAKTLNRVKEESRHLRSVFATATSERLWDGRFAKPVGVPDPGKGFGARRIINGQPRSPHSGVDYSAAQGTPVVAANAGRVALVAEHFFPGRLVVLDHGFGLYTFYFHLERVDVQPGQLVERGQALGAVGATGRATGPHLHFAARLGRARIDPTALLRLPFSD